jgi:hypothetical protein
VYVRNYERLHLVFRKKKEFELLGQNINCIFINEAWIVFRKKKTSRTKHKVYFLKRRSLDANIFNNWCRHLNPPSLKISIISLQSHCTMSSFILDGGFHVELVRRKVVSRSGLDVW